LLHISATLFSFIMLIPTKLISVSGQRQEAVYGVEEELLIEEARDIKKEARRKGLTERVNALLRERKFEGELIS
jgi:hypothetical protein